MITVRGIDARGVCNPRPTVRADLDDAELAQLDRTELLAALTDMVSLEMSWGMRLQGMGVDPNLMFERNFDPTEYGLASDRCFPLGIRGDAP